MTTRLADMAFIFHIWCTEWDLEIEPLRFPPVCFEQLNHTHAAHQARVVHLRTNSNRWKRTCWCTTFLAGKYWIGSCTASCKLIIYEVLSPSKRLGELFVLHMHAICMTSRKIHKQCYTERLPTRDAKSRPSFISANESPLYWFALGQTRVYLIGPCFASCFFSSKVFPAKQSGAVLLQLF